MPLIYSSLTELPPDAAWIPCHNVETAFYYLNQLERDLEIGAEWRTGTPEYDAPWYVVMENGDVN